MGNCHDCKGLEYATGDVGDTEGFCCNNRQYQRFKDEHKHLKQLDSEKYRLKGKSCCEI